MKIVPNTYNSIYFNVPWNSTRWYLKRNKSGKYNTYYTTNGIIGKIEFEYTFEEVKEQFKSGNWTK